MATMVQNYILFVILITQALLAGLVTLYFAYNNTLIPLAMILSMQLFVILNYIMSILFFKRIIIFQQQEAQLQKQSQYLQTMESLLYDIRSQRHDFLNHLQTVYGLLQMGKFERAQNYISAIATDARNSNQLINLNHPELCALIQQKTGSALEQSINFEITVQTDLSDFKIQPYYLNRILGNLIDNGFDAVTGLDPDKRKLWLNIIENNDCFVITIINTGPEINSSLINKIFEPGFSTKGTGRGLGLTIVKQLVEENGGTITVSSPPTTFTLTFPRGGS